MFLQAKNNKIQNEVMSLTRDVEPVRKELIGEKGKRLSLKERSVIRKHS